MFPKFYNIYNENILILFRHQLFTSAMYVAFMFEIVEFSKIQNVCADIHV